MACFLLEAEYATLLHLSPSVLLSELQTTLPASEELWAAPTAEAWRAAHAVTPAPAGIEAVVRQVLTDSLFPIPSSLVASSLSARILVLGLHLLLHATHQLRLAKMGTVAAMAGTGVRRSLGRLGRGPSPFKLCFSGRSEIEPGTAAAEVAYHLAQIATYLALEEWDMVAGMGSDEARAATRRKVGSSSRHQADDAQSG